VEATRKPSVRYRRATFMPDGKSLIVLSDESGEVEVWQLPANGVGPAEQLTRDASVLRWEAVPSPDGKWIAHHDKGRRLWLWSMEKKTDTLVATSRTGDFQDLAWSPDSRWLAYTAPAANLFGQIFIYGIEGAKATPVTTDRFDASSAAWSPDGEFLYFLSDRNLKTLVPSPWGPASPTPSSPARRRSSRSRCGRTSVSRSCPRTSCTPTSQRRRRRRRPPRARTKREPRPKLAASLSRPPLHPRSRS
jgi:tricorn protease